ncbi:MAG: hypothetical protein JWM28_1370, partial [Chitinophagaceae bacterium]|nr:hypothetical protein [Chitinophagaceae bacterium]
MVVQLNSNPNGIQKKPNNYGYAGKPVTETITNGFFTVDSHWIVRYWNRAAEILLKVPAAEIVGKNLWEKFAATISLNSSAAFNEMSPEEIALHFKTYWPEMAAKFDIIAYYCDNTLSVSFTKCNQSANSEYPEQQLKMLNELYKFVTEVTNDSLWEWNLRTNEIFWIDGGHKRAFGYQIENALIPQSFWESRLHPDDKVRVVTKLNQIITGGTAFVWEDEYRFQKANGDYAYVHDRGHIIYERDQASRMIGATQDISTRKSAEMNLLESERKLSLIARQTMNVVIITDSGGKITWVNNAFTRITEYEPQEVMGRKPGSFLQGKETNPTTVQYMRQKMNGKQPFECDIINYTKTGRKYWMHIQGQALLDEKGNCERYFAIETDITDKVLLENQLMQERGTRQREITDAVLTAQESERDDIGKELHDNLNQILGAAKLYIELAKRNVKKKEKIYLDESCNYIINVIEEIRKISKILIVPSVQVMRVSDNIKNLIVDL